MKSQYSYNQKFFLISFVLGSLLLASFSLLHAQVSITPNQFDPSTTVTIQFDATKGNQALMDYPEDIYMHTGIIQGTALNPTGWTYVQGNWGEAQPKMKLDKVGDNLYEISFNIHEFYSIPKEEGILQIAMVFRDAEGSIVAKTENDKDFYFPQLEILEHGKMEKLLIVSGEGFGEVRSISKSSDGKKLIIKSDRKSLTVSQKQHGILNFRYYADGEVNERRSFADILDNVIELEYKDDVNTISIGLENGYSIKINKKQFSISLSKSGKIIFSSRSGPEFIREFEGVGPFSFMKVNLEKDEHIYGLGSRALPNDRVGQRLYVYNKPNYDYKYGEDDVYLSLPYYLSSNGYGFLMDSYRKSVFDIGKSVPSVLEMGAKEDHLSFYLIYDESPVTISQYLSELTGTQELPPLWALGYFQSRYGYQSQKEVEDIVNRTLEAGYPIDATVLDLYWFGGTSRMGDFDWDRDSFPDPDRLINGFDEKGVETILITESYVVENTTYFNELDSLGFFAKDKNGDSYIIKSFWCGPAALIDVSIPEVSAWLWKIYKREYERGAAAWWCDSGEPENHPHEMIHSLGPAEEIHNAYALEWAKIFYENFRRDYPNKRLLNLTRSGYPGMQRYNTVPWSGDVSRTWSALRAQPNIMVGTGLSGVPYIHHDIGGFTGTVVDEELYIRWMQLGVFSPVMRVHGDGHMIPPEPIFYSNETQEIVKENIRLRYEFLPYNYQLASDATALGKPFVRPMFYHYPNDEIADTINEQFLWGENILVAPILNKGQKTKQVYLAGDEWYDFHRQAKILNQNWIEVPTELDKIPLFVKAGSVIPLSPRPLNNTKEFDKDHLALSYYYDDLESTSFIYLDDGTTHQDSPDYESEFWIVQKSEDKKWITINFLNITLEKEAGKKKWDLSLIGLPGKKKCIKASGKNYKLGRDYIIDPNSGIIQLSFNSQGDNLIIKIKK